MFTSHPVKNGNSWPPHQIPDHQAREIEPLEDSPIYKEDWLGLRLLQEKGALHTLVMEGDHMDFKPLWFEEYVIDQYLK